jgi:hypothetical protein
MSAILAVLLGINTQAEAGSSPGERAQLLVLALFPGPAPALYLWAWLLLPDASGKIVLQTWIQNKSL